MLTELHAATMSCAHIQPIRLVARTVRCSHLPRTRPNYTLTYTQPHNTLQHNSVHNHASFSTATAVRASNPKRAQQPGKTVKKVAKKQPFRIDQQQNNAVETVWSINNALPLIRCCSNLNFNESIEMTLCLNLDPRKPNQSIRGVCSLPHGTGKSVKIAVFARTPDKVVEAQSAGADIVGSDELVQAILAGNIDFERCIATPDMMSVVGRVARVLGPRGLMPNPKLGTVTNDLSSTIRQLKQGQIQYKTDRFGTVSAAVGKMNFDNNKLVENIDVFVSNVLKEKPSGAKGQLLLSAYISSSMGVSVPLDIKLSPFVTKKAQYVAGS